MAARRGLTFNRNLSFVDLLFSEPKLGPEPRRRLPRLLAWNLLWIALFAAPLARAEPAWRVNAHLAGEKLGKAVAFLEDKACTLRIEDVAGAKLEPQFRRSFSPDIAFGFTTSAYWLRFEVENASSSSTEWLLEAAYPSLDYVELFVPRADGRFEHRRSGDRIAFRERDLEYRNVVFSLKEPPRGVRTYYMRVQTSGSMLVPLRAWSPGSFLTHTNTELPVLWMFYGLMLVMLCYNAFLFIAVRERDYVFYCLYISSYGLFQFSVNGHTSQYLFTNQTWLANQLLLVAGGSAFFWSCWFHRSFLQLKTTLPRADQWLRGCQALCAVIIAYTFFGSYSTSVRLIVPFGLLLTLMMLANAIVLFRRGYRPAKLYTWAWAVFHVGITLFILKTLALLPSTWLTDWSILLGASLEILLLSLALADRINVMRAKLGVLNQQLSSNVEELQIALVKSEAAMQAKSNFLATVSHELRTPLNAIINIPAAVLKDFPELEGVSCAACHSVFELEEDETWEPASACPECGATGTLSRERVRRYCGKPDDAVLNLGYVERAGTHLLQVVNGILDFSKMEADKLALELTEIPVKTVVEDALGPLGELAKQKRLRIHVALDEAPVLLRCDPLRVRQVLINLVGNAIKFSDGPGRVSVSVRDDGDSVKFQVADEGIGIAPADRERIFESFQQAHRSHAKNYGGTGLGLSISRSLVEMHGGTLWLEARDGPGSTFCFTLPKRGSEEITAAAPHDGAQLTQATTHLKQAHRPSASRAPESDAGSYP